MIKYGRYEADFGAALGLGSATLEVQDGRFTGMTAAGVPLEGTWVYDLARNLIAYELIAHVPPNHETLTGMTTGAQGRRVVARGEAASGLHGQRFSLGFAGRAIDVSIRYAGAIVEPPSAE